MFNWFPFFQKKNTPPKFGLKDLVPLNLLEEKQKFIESGFTYNPQFRYTRSVSVNYLQKQGLPEEKYLLLAQNVIQNHTFIEKTAPSFLSQENVEKQLIDSLKQYRLEDEYRIIFSDSFISRVAVHTGDKHIKFRLPLELDQENLTGIIHHEIETHLLRRYNYEQQLWFKKRKKYGLSLEYARTEEGLAVVHELLDRQDKSLFKSALNYLSVDLALHSDFRTVFDFFYQHFNQDFESSWFLTLKKKRGLTDTARPGCITKDIVYFEGAIVVLEWLKTNDFTLEKLYYGKIALEDADKAVGLSLDYQPITPIFFQDKADYQRKISQIIDANLDALL